MSETKGAASHEMAEFVGRRAELALVRQTLCAARLVTLTGPERIGNPVRTRKPSTLATGSSAVPTSPSLGQLTRREQDVAVLVATGMPNSKIAPSSGTADRTVETRAAHHGQARRQYPGADIRVVSCTAAGAPPLGSGAPGS